MRGEIGKFDKRSEENKIKKTYADSNIHHIMQLVTKKIKKKIEYTTKRKMTKTQMK